MVGVPAVYWGVKEMSEQRSTMTVNDMDGRTLQSKVMSTARSSWVSALGRNRWEEDNIHDKNKIIRVIPLELSHDEQPMFRVRFSFVQSHHTAENSDALENRVIQEMRTLLSERGLSSYVTDVSVNGIQSVISGG